MTSADILSHLVGFVSDKQFLFFAPVSRSWKGAWGQRRALTSYVTAETSLSQLRYSFRFGIPREGVDWCTLSARVGNLEVLKWARRRGCLWDEQTCTLAASGGHKELLLWARREGCPWNEQVSVRWYTMRSTDTIGGNPRGLRECWGGGDRLSGWCTYWAHRSILPGGRPSGVESSFK